jgi:hypothetical protein
MISSRRMRRGVAIGSTYHICSTKEDYIYIFLEIVVCLGDCDLIHMSLYELSTNKLFHSLSFFHRRQLSHRLHSFLQRKKDSKTAESKESEEEMVGGGANGWFQHIGLHRWIPCLGPTKKWFVVVGLNTRLQRTHRFSSADLSLIWNSS